VACGVAGRTLCLSCLGSLREPCEGSLPEGVAAIRAPWAYEGPIRSLILSLKVRGLRTAAIPLVEGMTEASRRQGLQGSVVTWVPGHRADIRRRGFDHAEVLGRGLAREIGLGSRGLLRRRHSTEDQTALSARARAANVRGAFCADSCPASVVLVDDLITTGATASACAYALLAAGAEHVELVVASRA
jgi:predicted amidophosphoribosyltransferase